MIPVKGCVKNYHWGKVGEDSYIAKFQAVAPKSSVKSASNGSNQETSQQPQAELWFGSHPSGPASLVIGDQFVKLDEFLAKQPEMVGVVEQYFKFNKQLPFLFKILSVAQPLSLQAHPDRKLAQILHKNDPKNYKDSNHKPELAIALTDFEVLCDFRPHLDIVRFLKSLAPLRRIIGEKNFEQYNNLVSQKLHNVENLKLQTRVALAACFKSLMECQKDTISKETKCLLDDCGDSVTKDLLNLVSNLSQLYPGDPGLFAPFFLNYMKLTPGQAVYLKANKLHAYLRGECIECMACSDNVVRAGLTTKFRDVQALITMLDYEPVVSAVNLILPARIEQPENLVRISSYAPTDEFKVDKIVIGQKENSNKDFTLRAVSSGSFIIVLNGKARARDFFQVDTVHKIGFGFAGFVPPKIALKLSDIQGTLVLYRAYC